MSHMGKKFFVFIDQLKCNIILSVVEFLKKLSIEIYTICLVQSLIHPNIYGCTIFRQNCPNFHNNESIWNNAIMYAIRVSNHHPIPNKAK